MPRNKTPSAKLENPIPAIAVPPRAAKLENQNQTVVASSIAAEDLRAEVEQARAPELSRLELAIRTLESRESQRRSYEGQIDKLERRLKALESVLFATRVGGSSGSALSGAITTSFTAGSVLFVGPSGVLSQDNANFFFNDANNWLGIGVVPGSVLDILESKNSESLLQLANTNAGVAAQTTLRAFNGTSLGQLTQFGVGYTTAGIFRQNGSIVYATGAGGLTLATGANQPVYFAVNNAEVGRWTSAGLGIGMTPVNILDITQTQNAETLVQVLNASAGTTAKITDRLYNGTSYVQLTQFGSAWTTSGIFRQNGGLLQATGAGGLTLETDVNQPIYVCINGVETAQFIAARFKSNVPIKPPSYTVAGLPAATAGDVAFVTDSTLGIAAGLGLAPVGGGTNGVTVFCDNTPAWKIG